MRDIIFVLSMATVACGSAPTSEFEALPEQPPMSDEGEASPEAAPTPCTDAVLDADTQWTGIGGRPWPRSSEPDGLFRIHLSTQEDACEEVGWWGGWAVAIRFEEGRPVPGTYALDGDANVSASASHALGKTQATSTQGPAGRLQIFEVYDDGTIDGALCDVVINRDSYDGEMDTLTLHGRFTAGPC